MRTNKSKAVTVIVPVYGDYPSLEKCVESLIDCLDYENHKVLLVNDHGPDSKEIEKKLLAKIKGLKNFSYKHNPQNLGFVKTCNKAVFEYERTNNDVLLLNSDTLVTRGFLEEMSAVLYAEKNIAAVSPRSNNATIATVPIIAMAQKGIEPKKSYKLFKKINKKMPRYHQIPTGHGFCMLIRRDVIKKYGLFDEIFGKGYGEENDFSYRIKKHGYINVLANHAFVYHMEARSFTPETKLKLLKRNRKIIDQRYPTYTRDIRGYIAKAMTEEPKLYPIRYRVKRYTSKVKNKLRST